MRRLSFVLLLGVVGACVWPTAAQAYRYPIVLTGDSITESVGVRGNGFQGLGMELSKALRGKGLSMGGYGFVPTHMATCCIHKGVEGSV